MHLRTLRLRNNHCDSVSCLPPLTRGLKTISVDDLGGNTLVNILRLLLGRSSDLVPNQSERHCKSEASAIPTRCGRTLLTFTHNRPNIHRVFIPPRSHSMTRSNVHLNATFNSRNSKRVGTRVLTRPKDNVARTVVRAVQFGCSYLRRMRHQLTVTNVT